MVVTPADLILWNRCHRRWVKTCYPVGVDGAERVRRPALPVEMTGEAQLREGARVIADALYSRVGSAVSPFDAVGLGVDDAPAIAMLPVLALDDEQIALWDAATRRAVTERRAFVHGVLAAEHLAVLVDHATFHAKVDGWEFSLFRAATGVRGSYYTEASAVVHVADRLGIPVAGLHLYYLNKNRSNAVPGDTDPLYLESNVLKRARKGAANVVNSVNEIVACVENDGAVDPSYRCSSGCEVCTPRRTDGESIHTVRTLHKAGRVVDELVTAGVTDLRDTTLPLSRLTKKQRIQVESVRSGARHVDGERLRAFLDSLVYPLIYLDFEAFAPALPPFSGVAPYQHVPTLVSIHMQESPEAEPQAASYVTRPGSDERAAMFRWLNETAGPAGSIVVFSKTFETAMIRDLAGVAGDAEAGRSLVSRVVDLLEPFSEFWVYDPDQRGKVSLKRVLPVFTDVVGYGAATIKDGMHANLGYMRLTDRARIAAAEGPRIVGAARAAEGASGVIARHGSRGAAYLPTPEEIREYCAVDTIAMYHLVEVLRDLVGASNGRVVERAAETAAERAAGADGRDAEPAD